MVKRSIDITQVNLEQFTASDIARIFEGLAVLDEQNQFKGTLLKTNQLKDFVNKFSKVEVILKLAKMYQINDSTENVHDFYSNLINSVKLLKLYQTIVDKPEGLIDIKVDDEIHTLARFLSASPMKIDDVTVRDADDQAAYKLISAAKVLREQLKLDLVSTEAQVEQALQTYKLGKLAVI